MQQRTFFVHVVWWHRGKKSVLKVIRPLAFLMKFLVYDFCFCYQVCGQTVWSISVRHCWGDRPHDLCSMGCSHILMSYQWCGPHSMLSSSWLAQSLSGTLYWQRHSNWLQLLQVWISNLFFHLNINTSSKIQPEITFDTLRLNLLVHICASVVLYKLFVCL